MPELATIGYENRTLPELIARLREAGVEVLVDVRAVAASRKAGFSKTILGESLAEAGIEYVHLRGVRHQHSWDRSGVLRKGGFLAHRNPRGSEDETEIRATQGTT